MKIATDVTESFNQQKELEKKNTYLEHAAKILRHDMHSGINTYMPRGLSSLDRRLSDEQIKELKVEAPIKMIKEGLRHTQKVYKGVYEFTNLVKKDVVLNRTECDLKYILDDYLSATAYRPQVDLSDIGTLSVNEALFCTALDNLIRNGLKYNDSDNKIVKIYRIDDTLYVEDNGRGLSSEEFKLLSQPYTRKEGQKEAGTGLGLNICIAILEEHGFSVSCDKLPQVGSQIKINLKNDSILLVDDESLFHLVFEDACSLLDISLSLESLDSSDEAAKLFSGWQKDPDGKPECVFVDLNIIGSSYDGIELIRKINFEYGNNVVIGIISSSNEPEEQAKAVKAGAQFWIIKSDDIEPRLEDFKNDFPGYKNRTNPFKIYK